MSTSYIAYHPEQQQLLPSALQDWLPQGHLAYFINDTVQSLDLSAFHLRYATGGPRNQPFHPAMMVKIMVYAYATGTFSSRKIAKKLYEDVAFRVLAAQNFPAHRTIRDFRALHLSEFTELFVQVVRLAREMGLVKLGTIAVDGTKIKANASRHKAMSYARMHSAEIELKAQITALVQKAANTDEAEKNEPDLDIPAEIERRQARLAAIEAAKARLEERQRQADSQRGRTPEDERKPKDKDGKPKGGKPYQRDFGVPAPKAQDSFTDPESRIRKRAGGGFDYSYNAQTAVDESAHIIVAAEVVNTSSDVQQLPMVLRAVKAHTGAHANQWLDQERSGVSPVQHAGIEEGTGRVQARVFGAQSAQNGGDAGKLKVKHSGKRQSDATGQLQSATVSPATCVLIDAFTIVSILLVPAGEYTARKITLPPRLLGTKSPPEG